MLNKIQKILLITCISLSLVIFLSSQVNWNPSGQVRKVEPWQDWKIPVAPAELEAYEFAHSIKLPDEPKPDNFFKEGVLNVHGRTSSDEYFNYLCKTEAGEFIYKTIEDVEGVYQMRPRRAVVVGELQDRYAMEDPWGYTDREAKDPWSVFINPPWNNYLFLETTKAPDEKRIKINLLKLKNPPVFTGGKYWIYSEFNQLEKKLLEAIQASSLKSRYGYIWRGIRRLHDRENGIAGGELIILDLQTKEVLAVKRNFIRSGRIRNNRTGIDWSIGQVCPNTNKQDRRRSGNFIYLFVSKVLIPKHLTDKDIGIKYGN